MIARLARLSLALLGALVLTCGTALANITTFDVVKILPHGQFTDGEADPSAVLFFVSRVFFDTPGDLASVTTSYAGPRSPLPYLPGPGNRFTFLKVYTSLAAMDADFPDGSTYHFEISGGALGTLTADLTTPTPAPYAAEAPFLTGATFSQLQTMDPTEDFTFAWNAFTPAPGTHDSFVFFSILRPSDAAVVFSQGPLPHTQTSLVLPANTLEADTTYAFFVNFSSRIETEHAELGGATGVVAFDVQTGGSFVPDLAAVPAQATVLMLGLGVLVGTLASRRRIRVTRADGTSTATR